MIKKRRLHRKWLRSSPADRAHNRLNYITIQNSVNRMMTQARRAYEQNICNKSKRKPKIFWSHVRCKLKSTSGTSFLLESPVDKSSLKHDDCSSLSMLALSILQNQFCSVFTRRSYSRFSTKISENLPII